MTSPKVDLTNPIYHDNDAAREHLESLLWPDGPNCPRCGVMGDRITKLKGKSVRMFWLPRDPAVQISS